MESKNGNPAMEPIKPKVYLHELRKQIDACIIDAGNYKQPWSTQEDEEPQNPFMREMALAYTKLQEAKMWVGKCLEQLGSELPKEFQDKAEKEVE